MNTQITHFIRQHVSQPDRLGNICASNTRSQHVRSELVLEQPQLLAATFFVFWLGQLRSVATRRRARLDSFEIVSAAVPPIENRVSCCPVSVRVCVSVFVGVLVCLPVFVCENLFMPNARINHMKEGKKERNSNTKQIIFSVYKKTTKRILRKWQKQKSNQHLKCWICLLFRLIAIPIDRDVVRHVARKTFSFATEIEAIRLIAWLIYFCTWFATHAPRRATWLALQLHRSIDPSIARLQFQLESKWSCLLRVQLEEAASVYPSLLFARVRCAGAAIMLICVPCDFIDRLTEPNRSTPLIGKKFAMQRMKIDLMIARAWSTTFLSDRRVTRPQIRLYVCG